MPPKLGIGRDGNVLGKARVKKQEKQACEKGFEETHKR
jgi:hypothetical protein